MSWTRKRKKVITMTQASTETAVQTEIDDVANQYFDLVYTNDLAIIDRIFDGNAHLYGKNEAGEVLLWPIARYRAVLASRQSPEKLGAPRQQEILARDFASPTQAFVKVRVRINSLVFVDYLTLIKLSTGWKSSRRLTKSSSASRPITSAQH